MSNHNTLYCIEYKGVYNNYFSYVYEKNIKELAKTLNRKLSKYPVDIVLNVFQASSYDDKFSFEDRLFFDCEYSRQRFFETYEERLIEQHKILAV